MHCSGKSEASVTIIKDLVRVTILSRLTTDGHKGKGKGKEIHLRTTGRHLSMGSHSVICHPTEVIAPPSPQPGRLILNLSTP